MSKQDTPLLQVKDLHVHFPIHGGVFRRKIAEVRAVDGVSFDLQAGEVLGLVGESGSGKTTVGRAIANLHRFMSPGVVLKGDILLRTRDGSGASAQLNGVPRAEMQPHRSRVQMIFQDPYSSLNPRMSVRQLVERPMELHLGLSASERSARVIELLGRVGLQPDHADRYPHEFSGGQRQRIGIARALATNPEIIVADEPVSALDVSVQAQVINLMAELQRELGLTYVFVAHDLSVVYHISTRIAVMYLGEIVEIGSAEQVYRAPRHPYSRALLSAVPQPDPRADRSKRVKLEGDIPSPMAKPSGCGFRTRCPLAQPSCAEERPVLRDVGEGQLVACPIAD